MPGACWLSVEGVADAVRLETGDCFLLPSGRPFRLASDLTVAPIDAHTVFLNARNGWRRLVKWRREVFFVGGDFALTGCHAGILLGMLPPVVHIRKESDRAAKGRVVASGAVRPGG